MIFPLEMIVRSSLVVAAGLFALWLFRRQPAAFRHWLVAGTLVLAAAQPALNLVVPAWRVEVGRTVVEDIDGPIFEAEQSADARPFIAAQRAREVDWRRVFGTIWVVGLVVSLATMVLGCAWLTILGRRATAAGRNWIDEADAIKSQLGLRRPVRILITSHPALLVTWGAIAPVILLPAGAATWSRDRIRLVIAHEIAHLRRHDWVIQLAAELARALNWFNPLFWLACERLRRESEHACDDIVLEMGIGGTSYASHLVALARAFNVHGRTWLPAPSIARPSTLERRVHAMLNPQLNRRPLTPARRIALAMLLVAIALPIAAAARAQNAPSGTVTDPSGRPLADAAVRLNSLSGETSFDARTDHNGHFQLPEVPAGDYLLSVRSPGFSTQRQRVQLSGGGVTFALRLPVGTLRETVTVKGASGAPGSDGARSVSTAAGYEAPVCSPTDLGGKLTPPRKIRDVRPRYKTEWLARNLAGSVLMHATIGADGKVRNVEVVSGSEMELEDEALAAVSQWEFSSTYLNCQPVEVRMFVTVNFTAE